VVVHEEVSSSDGIGACSASECRSDSTMMRAPSSMAAETSALISASRSRRAWPPPAARYRPQTVTALRPGRSPSALMWMSLASSSLSMTGKGSSICRHAAGLVSSRLSSGPIVVPREVTSSSRIASSGGLVTCANSWVK
jgi:hypothetical protein